MKYIKPTLNAAEPYPWDIQSFDDLAKDFQSVGGLFKKFFATPSEFDPVPVMPVEKAFLPYNYTIEKTKNKATGEETTTHIFEIACAGFSKEDIKVTKKHNVLSVEFSKPTKEETEDPDMETVFVQNLHVGLTSKTGKLQWAHKSFVNAEIMVCKIENGVLLLKIKEKPDEASVEMIEIQ